MKHPERSPIPASGLPVRRLLVWAALAVPLAGAPFQDARAGCREVAQTRPCPAGEAPAGRRPSGERTRNHCRKAGMIP